MSLNFVTAALKADVQIQAALELVEYKQSVELGIPSAALPYLAGLFSTQCAGSLVICATDRIAQDVAAQIADFVDPNEIAYFPAWETLPHERMSPSGDTIGTRMAILRQLANPNESSEIKYLVTSVRAAIQPMAAGLGDVPPLVVTQGQTIAPDQVIAQLVYFNWPF